MASGATYPPNNGNAGPVVYYSRDGELALFGETRPGEPCPFGQVMYIRNFDYLGIWSTEDGSRSVRVEEDGQWIDWTLPVNIPTPANNPLPPSPRNPVIHVSIRKINGYRWVFEVKQDDLLLPMPSLDVIKRLVPKEYKRLLHISRRSRGLEYNLGQALDAGLPVAILHDALKAWAFGRANAVNEMFSSTPLVGDDDAFLLRAQPATLAVGGKIYRLVPTGEVNVKPIIAQVRRKAIELAKVEAGEITNQATLTANNLRDRATVDSRTLVRQAEDRAARIRNEMEAARRLESVKPPQWVTENGFGCKYSHQQWHVGFFCKTKVTGIRFRVRSWQATIWWNPVEVAGHSEEGINRHPIKLWVPIGPEGQFDISTVCSETWATTHIHQTGTCMELQGLPTRIANRGDLDNLRLAIERGFQVVNLNSPLNTSINDYFPPFKEQLPKVVLDKLTSRFSIDPGVGVRPDAYRDRLTLEQRWDRIETDAEELAATFTVAEGR